MPDNSVNREIARERRPDVASDGWQPSGRTGWVLSSIACVLIAVLGTTAYCMVFPVRWDGLGMLGAVALFFPLHLLAVTVLAAVLACVARRRRVKFAAAGFGLLVFLTAAMALTPTIATWRQSRELNVPLSLGEYLANAGRLNTGLPQTDRSVVYGTARDATKLMLDVWRTGRPNTGALRPAVVIVHGGAWDHGHRGMFPDWNVWLNGLGYEVFDVEYRMPPPLRWKDEVGDVKSALGWVAAHAAEYHVDPARISLLGNSAGANLCLLAAFSMGDPRLPPSTDVPPVAVRSIINLYGPTELTLLHRSSRSAGYLRAALARYVGGTPEEFPERYRLLSPVNHVGTRTPPVLTVLGTSDRIVGMEQADLLDEALARAGVVHETCRLRAHDHGFDVNWGGFGTQIARARVKAFLARH